jgi:DNA (cytosine-5)-methyltransferase 1
MTALSEKDTDIQFIVIDLFCGAGGTTTGFELADSGINEHKVAKVVACVNHDPVAIKSHWANHPEVEHFEEDITTLYGVVRTGILLRSAHFMRLIRLVDMYRAYYPNAKVILWASLECTNFSKAKGGMPRDADSRTLAEHLEPYIVAIDPDYIQIENVVEFMSWGPLDSNGKPISRKNGQDWLRWRESVCALGYIDEWREINSADFGALTSRNRLFGCFSKHHLPIVWPLPTHSKTPQKTSLINPLRKWEPVKKALDFSDEGNSVFNRKKELSTKTMQRLFMGCVKHIAGGKKAFISKYYSGKPEDKNISVDGPAGTITTRDSQALVFITKAFSSNSGKSVNAGVSVEDPCPTVSAQNRLGVAKACFIQKYNSNRAGTGGNNGHSVDEPAPVITTQVRMSLAQAHFLTKYYGNGDNTSSINDPAGTIPTKDRMAKVCAEKWLMNTHFNNVGSSLEDPSPVITADGHAHYIINPSWGGNSGSVNEPCHVVVARQDKAPLGLITCVGGCVAIPVYDTDCEWTIKLKEFMVLYDIADIKMRMLKVPELKQIQGFPESYILLGNQTDQKKFIGNSVHPFVPKNWIEAFSTRLYPESYRSLKVA